MTEKDDNLEDDLNNVVESTEDVVNETADVIEDQTNANDSVMSQNFHNHPMCDTGNPKVRKCIWFHNPCIYHDVVMTEVGRGGHKS